MNSVTVPPEFTLKIAEARALNPLVRLIRLEAPDGAALPPWTAGAHIQVQVRLADGASDWRHYSLIDLERGGGADASPDAYTIAVRREAQGRGGSRFMHEELQPGDLLRVRAPVNNFALRQCGGATVLLAGGIGITPLSSMAACCRAQGRSVRLHYAGRSRGLMAFMEPLQSLLGDDLRVHADDECAGVVFDIDALLKDCGPDDMLYVCGPRPMLDAVLAAEQALGWAPGRVHFELFTTPVAEEGDRAFEVELAQSGQKFMVSADQTVLDCLIEHGCDPLYDCKRGECGVCTVTVLEGEVDHRDYVLTQSEKDSGAVMQICVSRAKGARLVLDL